MFSDHATPPHVACETLLAALNAPQRAAVTLPAEHALILAGAGSGKTRVLTTRIAWLIQTGQVSPGGVLAVTFTNKAAREMLTRLGTMLPINVHGMWIGTFHGLCNRFLRTHHRSANLPVTFQILDTQDQLSAIKRLCKQHQIDDELLPPKQLQWFIAGCKEEGLRPQHVVVHDADTRRKVDMYQLYEEQCQREGVVDFGELMLRSYEVLRDNDPLRQHYQRRFQHILIDEFQDTNKLQYAWIKLLAGIEGADVPGTGGAVLAVGDDDQSIYAFRGARVGNMADFLQEFGVRHQIKLEQNYRSHSNILDCANALISHNRQRLGKNLHTDQGPGEPVRVFEAASDFLESQWILDEVRQLARDQGTEAAYARREIAILYRSNAQSRILESALFNAGIPYKVYGGLRFFERAEVKHALAYLRLLENPHDDTSFLRVVNFPARGIGARSVEQLQDLARSLGCSLHDASSALKGRAGVAVGAFVARVDVMREQAHDMNLRAIMEWVLDQSGLLAHYAAERDGAERVENLEELVHAAESFVTVEGFGRDANAWQAEGGAQPETVEGSGEIISPLAAFLAHAALESGDGMASDAQDAVQLMTVHASKGLEFDCVFITGLEEGLFPHENAFNDYMGLEEERRLLYVAITRARKRLYLSLSQSRMLHGQTRFNLRSRFLDELPPEALKWLSSTQPRQRGEQGTGAYGAHGAWTVGYTPPDARTAGAATPPRPDPGHGLRLGQRVFHAKFGEGVVLTLEGLGDDARAQINFPRHGTKWLALAVAKLTAIE